MLRAQEVLFYRAAKIKRKQCGQHDQNAAQKAEIKVKIPDPYIQQDGGRNQDDGSEQFQHYVEILLDGLCLLLPVYFGIAGVQAQPEQIDAEHNQNKVRKQIGRKGQGQPGDRKGDDQRQQSGEKAHDKTRQQLAQDQMPCFDGYKMVLNIV